MGNNPISFEEIMESIMSATKDTFKSYMQIDVVAGQIEKKIEPVNSDVIGIVGVAGDRVGYIIFSTDLKAATIIAKEMLMMEETDDEEIRDAVGELANNIAGAFKSMYHSHYGSVALGLPLVLAVNSGAGKKPPESNHKGISTRFMIA